MRWFARLWIGWLAVVPWLGCQSATTDSPEPGPHSLAGAVPTTPEPPADPFAAAHLRRAQALMDRGRTGDALTELDEALRLAPNHVASLVLAAQARRFRLEHLAAIDVLERARALRPRDPEVLYLLADSYVQLGKFGPALPLYLSLLDVDPTYRDACKRLAFVYISTDQVDKVLPALDRAHQVLPDDVDVLLQRAIALRRTRQSERARADLEQARALAPRRADVLFELGLNLHGDGHSEQALTAFAQVAELDPLHEGALQHLLRAARQADDATAERELLQRFERTREFAKRASALRTELELDPTRTDLLLRLALLNAENGRLDEAEGLFARVLLIHPDDRSTATNLGRARMRLGRAADAIAPLQRAADLEPDVAWWRLELAEALLAAGEREAGVAAASAAAEAIQSGPTSDLLYLGAIYERASLDSAAIEAYSQAIAVDPDLGEAFAGRGLVRSRQRDSGARADLQRALHLGTRRTVEVRAVLAAAP